MQATDATAPQHNHRLATSECHATSFLTLFGWSLVLPHNSRSSMPNWRLPAGILTGTPEEHIQAATSTRPSAVTAMPSHVLAALTAAQGCTLCLRQSPAAVCVLSNSLGCVLRQQQRGGTPATAGHILQKVASNRAAAAHIPLLFSEVHGVLSACSVPRDDAACPILTPRLHCSTVPAVPAVKAAVRGGLCVQWRCSHAVNAGSGGINAAG